MILTYHKIKLFSGYDSIAIGFFDFFLKMLSLKRKEIVYLDSYNPDDKNQIVITFDDGYKEIIKYAIPVLKFFNYPFEVFLVSDFFDAAEQGNKDYCNKNDIKKIIKNGGRLQYHSKTHPHLDKIDNLEILKDEIKVPEHLIKLDPKGFNFFAYPFWSYNDNVISIVKNYFQGARSGNGFANNTVYAMDSERQGRPIKQ